METYFPPLRLTRNSSSFFCDFWRVSSISCSGSFFVIISAKNSTEQRQYNKTAQKLQKQQKNRQKFLKNSNDLKCFVGQVCNFLFFIFSFSSVSSTIGDGATTFRENLLMKYIFFLVSLVSMDGWATKQEKRAAKTFRDNDFLQDFKKC